MNLQPATVTPNPAKTEEFWFEYEGSFYNLPKNYSGYFAVKESHMLVLSNGKVILDHHYPI